MTPHRYARKGIPLLLGAVSVLLSGCSLSGPQSTFDAAGPVAQSQRDLFMFTFYLGLFVLAVVLGALSYALVRYRRRPGDDGIPMQIHGEARLEALWTIMPAFILIAIGVPTIRLILYTESYVLPGDGLEIHVTGHQWWWGFEYAESGVTTANELHIPVGRRIVLNLDSADVLHSFWVPRLAGKRDLIPNQDNQLWFIAEEPGVYRGHCAELCLTAHAYMRFTVVAHPEEEFYSWLASFDERAVTQQVAADPLVEQGAQLFKQKGCAACHAIAGVAYGQTGPNLTNFGERGTLAAAVLDNTPENLAAWLRNPQAVKPGNYMPNLGLNDDEIGALVAYLHSLGGDRPTTAEEHYGTR